MPLPTKSRYTITEAAKFIKCVTGEAVTQAQILDWGTQGLYRLHLAIEHCNIRPIGETEIIQVRDSITELRLSSGQAAILGRGERVGISACWHNGVECNFVRARTGDYSGWTPDTVYFGATALVLLGSELASFTAKFAEPLHNAPAPAPDTATLAPVVAGGALVDPANTASATGTAPEQTAKSGTVADVAKPWLQVDPRDPNPEHHWYTPARYFARQLVIADSTLLTKKPILADKVSSSLAGVGIFKRGGKKPPAPDTVLKAFANVPWG